MNPFDAIDEQQLSGLNGLDGFSFKRLKKKLKRTVRKVGKIAAPVAAFFVGGPAAAVAVGKAVLDRKEAKSDAKKQAKELGMSWGEFKKATDEEIQAAYERKQMADAAKITRNPGAPKIIQAAQQQVQALRNSPQYAHIDQQLAQQGYTQAQRAEMFAQSQPVRTIVQGATGAAVYGGARRAGYSPAVAAVTAGSAVDKVEEEDTLKKVLPFALPVAAMLLMNG